MVWQSDWKDMMLNKRQAGGPCVFAHYMPWFRAERSKDGHMTWEHWAWPGPGPTHDPDQFRDGTHRDIASVYYPLIGPYDGRDRFTLEYHMLTAKATGIDGFIADWYGPDDFTDIVFTHMVRAAERYGMKVAVCLEEKTFFPSYSTAQTRAEALDVMEGQIRYVLAGHARSDAYLRRNGAPVFLVFPGYEQTKAGLNVLTPAELTDVLGRFAPAEIVYAHSHLNPAYATITRASFVWNPNGQPRQAFYDHAAAARENGDVEYVIGGAYPGFDDTGVGGWGRGPRITDRRGTMEYDENWQEILRYQPDAVQIATWNDFGEGTTIEPTEEYGFTFLDLTEKYVNALTGRAINAAAKKYPYRLFLLRRAVNAFPDGADRQRWTRRLDGIADEMAREKCENLDSRLGELEAEMVKSHGESQLHA